MGYSHNINRKRRQPAIYSRTEKEPAGPRLKRNFLTFLFIILIAGLIYLLFFSSFFRISTIDISEIEHSDKDEIRKISNDFLVQSFYNQNIWLFSEKDLVTKIKVLGGIREVNIDKTYPNRISLEITEINPPFIWAVGDKKYLVDEKGEIWDDYDDRFNQVPVVIDLSGLTVERGSKVTHATFGTFISGLMENFEIYTNSTIEKMEVSETTEEIAVYSSAGWKAYFDTTKEAKKQIENMKLVLDKEKNKIEYIDLRMENKIFYK